MHISDLLIPQHIAVIMDGNSRWAKRQNLPISAGHEYGSKAVKTLVNSCLDFKVQYLTIYAFSTENWQRPKREVEQLMSLFKTYLEKEMGELLEKKIRIVVSGDLSNVEQNIKDQIKHIEQLTRHNQSLTLNVAFDYGSRQEIVAAIKKIILAIENKEIKFEQINEHLVDSKLYNPDIPDPDLLIRTSGEMRLSNFLLWQMAYTELYFTDILWPEFGPDELYKAILDFNKRERRYGKR